ncbi:uncharacterized protein VTP21DRAFT_10582 [Calcarisporiella thermophila]|uniref:uncharacterized protein n=1 Tax=Calcarisporiella thermophila TaxID=911321 RepID=UPI0037439C05
MMDSFFNDLLRLSWPPTGWGQLISNLRSNDPLTVGASLFATVFAMKYGYSIVYEKFFSPLRHIPGPFHLRVTGLTTLLGVIKGNSYEYLKKLHEQYGPVVVYNPGCVSFTSPSALQQILRKDDFPKGPNYEKLQGSHGEDIFTLTDKSRHKVLRRMLSPAFSISSLNMLETFFQSCMQELVEHVRAECQSQGGEAAIDMYLLTQRLALDIIGETAFGTPFNLVSKGEHPLPDNIRYLMQGAMLESVFPFIRYIPVLNGSKQEAEIDSHMRKIITDRRNSADAKRTDILQLLLDAQDPEAQALTDNQVRAQVEIFLFAGSETTSGTLFFILLLLLRHKSVLARLLEEIDRVLPDRSCDIPSHNAIKHLPYLNAVINEGLRVRPVTELGVIRHLTKPATVEGYHLPAGTNVIANFPIAHKNKQIWGADAHEFKPERFLEDYPREAYMPFSSGTRNCIGKNFALMELRMALVTLLHCFEFEDIQGQPEEIVNYITVGLRSNRYRMRVRPRHSS